MGGGHPQTRGTGQADPQVNKWDWKKIKEIAFGVLGLVPSEFWKMTYAEYAEMVNARGKRVEEQMELMAWQAQWIMAPHCKRVLSVDEMLGRKPKTPPMTREQKRREVKFMRDAWARRIKNKPKKAVA